MDSLTSDLSDLFKTLPPIKRAELTKTVEKLFLVYCYHTARLIEVLEVLILLVFLPRVTLLLPSPFLLLPQVSSNFSSEPLTPAKAWQEFQEISTLVEKVPNTAPIPTTSSPLSPTPAYSYCPRCVTSRQDTRCAAPCLTEGTLSSCSLSGWETWGPGLRGSRSGAPARPSPSPALLQVADYGTQGLGLKVTKDLKQGEPVITIPTKVGWSTKHLPDYLCYY